MGSLGGEVLRMCTGAPETVKSFSLESFPCWQYLIWNKTFLLVKQPFQARATFLACYPIRVCLSWRHYMNLSPFKLKNCLLNS